MDDAPASAIRNRSHGYLSPTRASTAQIPANSHWSRAMTSFSADQESLPYDRMITDEGQFSNPLQTTFLMWNGLLSG